MGLIRKEGFAFGFDPGACEYCPGKCCRGKTGHIWINDRELKDLSSFFELNTIDFINQYTVRLDNRLSIKERYVEGSYDCIFFDVHKNGCTVYRVRPSQCRHFPFWEECKNKMHEMMRECPGIREDARYR